MNNIEAALEVLVNKTNKIEWEPSFPSLQASWYEGKSPSGLQYRVTNLVNGNGWQTNCPQMVEVFDPKDLRSSWVNPEGGELDPVKALVVTYNGLGKQWAQFYEIGVKTNPIESVDIMAFRNYK